MRSCYHQNLSSDKRRPALVFLARTDNVTSGVFSYEWSSFLSTARATRRPQSSRMDARRAEALSSARLANAVPGSSCPCKGPRSANSCSSNWRPGPRGKVPNTHCEGEKPPLRLRLFLVLTASAIAFFVVKTLDSVLSTYPFQHCLEQSSVSLDSSDLLGALHPCLADLDSMLGKRTCKNSTVVNATITTQGLWPTSPTDPQADEAIQALSAGRRNVSLSQQYYLLKSSS